MFAFTNKIRVDTLKLFYVTCLGLTCEAITCMGEQETGRLQYVCADNNDHDSIPQFSVMLMKAGGTTWYLNCGQHRADGRLEKFTFGLCTQVTR